MPYYLGN